MSVRKLIPPQGIKIDFQPSPRQYELWKLLQPECPSCGGKIEQRLKGRDSQGNPQYAPQCSRCRNTNIPQLILGGGAAGKPNLCQPVR